MNNSLPIVLAALLGLVLGGAGVWLLSSLLGRRQMLRVAERQAQDTVADLLDVLATAGLLLDSSNQVIRTTTGCLLYTSDAADE